MMTHGTYTATQDTGLTPLEQAARTAEAHSWALRVINLMVASGCSVQLAVQAVADALKEQQQ